MCAFIVGVDEYSDPDIDDLENGANDAVAFAEKLQSQHKGKVRVILVKNCSSYEVEEKLDEYLTLLRPHDAALLYFA